MRIINRKYHRNYEQIETYESGIVLTGSEAKSIKEGNMRLEDAFVKIMGDELYLINADVPIYHFARPQGYDTRRRRKLLLHRKEILKLQVKLAGHPGLTIAPVSCYNKGSLIKLEIALSRGRKDLEKRKLVKQRDVALQQKREAREFMKK